MKILKRAFIVIGVFILLILIGVAAMYFTTRKSEAAYKDFDFGTLALTNVEDGTYTGSEDGGMVKASVEVTVKDYTITKVTILSHDNALGTPAEVIVNDIVEKNSLEVDSISGATYSSYVIKTAVYNALTGK